MVKVKQNAKYISLGIVVVSLMALIIFLVGRSYGFFNYTKKGETANIISIKGLKIDVIEDNDALNLEAAEPLYDEDGMKLEAFTFRITNTGSRPISYTLKVANDIDKQEACLINEGTVDEAPCPVLTTDNIRYSYSLNEGNYKTPANLGTKENVITMSTIEGKTSQTYSIKIWIKSDATNEIMEHYFYGQLILQGSELKYRALEDLEPGLYDDDHKLVASWDTLVNTYGLDIEKDYDSQNIEANVNGSLDIKANNIDPTSYSYIVNNNAELENGTVLVLGDVTKIGTFALISENLKELSISNTVTEIGLYSFAYDANLTSIVFQENSSLTTIGVAAFGVVGIKVLNIPSTVTTIGESAFMLCKVVNYTGTATSDNNWGAFSLNPYIENDFAYTDNTKERLVAYIGNATEITVPSTVTSIGQGLLYRTNVESIYISENVEDIDELAFNYNKLNTIVVDPNNTTYDSRNNSNAIIETDTNTLVAGCKNTIIPTTITSIGESAFSANDIESITIPDSVTTIGNKAFLECNSLTSVTFENPNGWKAEDTDITSTDLSNTSTAATYLKDTYKRKVWTRTQ